MVFLCVLCFFVVAPTTHVELSAWNAPRTAGPDSHGQCVKPTERKTTGPFAHKGQHLKTPLQSSFTEIIRYNKSCIFGSMYKSENVKTRAV